MLGRIQLGQPAQIWTDSAPDQPIDAKVGYIANRAEEFTPKGSADAGQPHQAGLRGPPPYPTQTSQLKLLPGQPADGMIRLSPDAPWHAPPLSPSPMSRQHAPSGVLPDERPCASGRARGQAGQRYEPGGSRRARSRWRSSLPRSTA